MKTLATMISRISWLATPMTAALVLSSCANSDAYLTPGEDVAAVASVDFSGTSFAHDVLTPQQILRLEDAPPPNVGKLSSWKPPVNLHERRELGRKLLTGGAIATGIGAVLMLTGGLLYGVPAGCDDSRDWFCGLSQAVAGISLIGIGAFPVAIGTIILGVGGYDVR